MDINEVKAGTTLHIQVKSASHPLFGQIIPVTVKTILWFGAYPWIEIEEKYAIIDFRRFEEFKNYGTDVR